MHKSVIDSELLVSIGSSPHLLLLAANQRHLNQNNKSRWVPDITCRFVHAIQRDEHQNYLSLWVPTLICGFCMQNSAFWTRLTSLYGSQTWPVVLCMYNSVLSIRIHVSMCPSPHLWFLHAKQGHLDQTHWSVRVPDLTCRFVHAIQRNYHQNYCIYGSHPLSVVFAFITATFGAELQVSMGPRPHLSFCACIKAWLTQNY